ncbi:putative centrosomal protein [Apostichopus japonicus]|uniref:Putative centrosomal protein n=1 Tax=Stichopus japonicus TaxID=307972 RepID=A0A2G8KUD3_STIJA|nr:putative centrosomal protein [Apostichopus japonicus]
MPNGSTKEEEESSTFVLVISRIMLICLSIRIMPRSGEVSLSLSGSQVSAVKRPSSSSGSRPNSSGSVRSGSNRPASSGSNRPNGNSRVASGSRKPGKEPSSARSVSFGSNVGTPRSSRKNTSDKPLVKGVFPTSAEERRKSSHNVDGPASGDMNGNFSSGSLSGLDGKVDNRRHKRASSLNTGLSTNRSTASNGSSAASLLKSKEMPSSDDFLALFDSSHHQPIIKNRTASKAKKVSTKKRQEPLSSRAFAVPISARSTSTVSSYEPQSSRPASGFDIHNDKLNSSRDFTPRLNPEDLISSHIDTKDLVKSSLANVLNSVHSGHQPQNMDDDFVENEEIVYRPSGRGRTHRPESLGEGVAGDGLERERQKWGQNEVEHPMAEELIQSMNDSATKIQRWYRGKKADQRKDGEDEIRKVLRTKWQERADMMDRERKEKETEEKREKDRKRIREEKQDWQDRQLLM